MFERTEHRDEEHVDERAHRFFTYGYMGNQKYAYTWDSLAKDAVPTTVIKASPNHVCVYCGRFALPLQKRVGTSHFSGEDSYVSRGHCCVCKEAMDEVEMNEQIRLITEQFNEALFQCRSAMPQRNSQVLLALMDRQLQQAKRDVNFHIRDGNVPSYAVEKAGFELVVPDFKK